MKNVSRYKVEKGILIPMIKYLVWQIFSWNALYLASFKGINNSSKFIKTPKEKYRIFIFICKSQFRIEFYNHLAYNN